MEFLERIFESDGSIPSSLLKDGQIIFFFKKPHSSMFPSQTSLEYTTHIVSESMVVCTKTKVNFSEDSPKIEASFVFWL